MNILALTRYSRRGASSRLRTFQYQPPLAEFGINMTTAPLFEDNYLEARYGRTGRISITLAAYWNRIRTLLDRSIYDALWVEKEALPWLPAGLELALLPRNIPVILDYDDAVFHRYDMHPNPVVRAALGRKLDRLMERADLVLAGNEYLAARAEQAGARRIAIVPTVVDITRYDPPPRRSGVPATVGWIGSPSTAKYLEIVAPAINQLAQEGVIRAVAIGAREDQLRGTEFASVAWSEESEVPSLQSCDIGIMPLADTPWERGKCGYKLIQYMALGLPVVASPIGVNASIVGHDRGKLASSIVEWYHALRSLATDPRERLHCGRAGRSYIEQNYSLQAWAPAVAAHLTEVVSRH